MVPSAKEIQAMGAIGIDMGRSGRASLMNQIGAALGMPVAGWHGQANLFERGDIRLTGLLQRMTDAHIARLIAGNLERAGRFVQVNLMLVLVSAHREAHASLTATGSAVINSYRQGGLDFLDRLKSQLGLPRTVTASWSPATPQRNVETGNIVYPERIPAKDQMLAYAAVIAASFNHNFTANLRAEFGDEATLALGGVSRKALIVWQAYAFLAPGGRPYDRGRKLREQLGQHFGHRSALSFYAHKAKDEHRRPTLDDILDSSLDSLEWIHSAKTRAAETLFVESLLGQARVLLP
jgi:hypothetical protein